MAIVKRAVLLILLATLSSCKGNRPASDQETSKQGSAAPAAERGESATTPAADSDDSDEESLSPEERAELEAEEKLDRELERLSELQGAEAIAKEYVTLAETLCKCESEGRICLFGVEKKIKVLEGLIEPLDKTAIGRHEAPISAAREKFGRCYQTKVEAYMAREKQISEAGRKLIEIYTKYADLACACKDMKCFEAAASEADSQASAIKKQTIADGMNDEYIEQEARLRNCQKALFEQ